MNLQEKLINLRKRSGLSQEALAERLGVSRQAISKWETGDASPELSKLVLIAKEFNVTTDWLLSDSDDEPQAQSTQQYTSYPDNTPGFLVKLIRKYGWLTGIYVIICGVIFTAFGFICRKEFLSFENIVAEFDVTLKVLPEYKIFTGIMIFGIIVIIAGIALAVFLKRKSKNK